MKLFNHFLIIFCGSILLFFSSLGLAQSPDDIYRNGKNSFDRGDYLSAVKFLFAYQKLAEGSMDQSLNETVNSAIKYCDEQISLAIRTKEDLDKYGHISEIVIESSGKADGSKPDKKSQKYQKPTAKYLPKPFLPSSISAIKYSNKTSHQIIKPLQFIVPSETEDKVDGKKDIETAENKLDALERRYKLLKIKCDEQIEKNKDLMERYRLLKDKYNALMEQ